MQMGVHASKKNDVIATGWRRLVTLFALFLVGCGLLVASGRAEAQSCVGDDGQVYCDAPLTGPWWWHATDYGQSGSPCAGMDVVQGGVRCSGEPTAWQAADQNFNGGNVCDIHRDFQRENDLWLNGSKTSVFRYYALTWIYYKIPSGEPACAHQASNSAVGMTLANGTRHAFCPPGFANNGTVCIKPRCRLCEGKRGHHIELATGEERFDELDYRGSGAMPLEFRRYYSSSGSYATPGTDRPRDSFGPLWHHGYQRSIILEPAVAGGHVDTIAYAVRPDGDLRDFKQVGGSWIGASDAPERLTSSADAQGNLTGWQYVSADDEVESYNASGVLQSIANRSGQSVLLTYSDASTPPSIAPAPGLLIAVTDSYNRSLQLRYAVASAYDATPKLTQMIDPAGNTFAYRYDANFDRLTYVDFPDGHSRNYLYNESALISNTALDQLTGIVDENNARYITYSFDSNGRISSEWLGSASADKLTVTSYGYVLNPTSQTVTTDALGNRTTYSFLKVVNGTVKDAGQTRCTTDCTKTISTSIAYDTTGYRQSKTDYNGRTTNYTYDDTRGLEKQRIEAVGKPEQRTSNTTWNTSFRVPDQRSVLNAGGAAEASTKWTYNTRGQPLSRCQIDPAVSGASSYTCGSSANAPTGVRQWAYAYCEQADVTGGTCPFIGLIKSVDGPRIDVSDTITYTYYQTTDESGCATLGGACHHLGDLYRVTNALGQITTYVSYDKNGKPTRIQDANGVYTDMSYHARGWLLTRTVRANANGTPNASLDATTTFAYDNVGNVTQVTQPDGTYLHYGYDDAHRLTDIYDSATPANYLQGDHIHYTLDAAGNRTDEKTSDPSGMLQRELSRTYDQLSHLTALMNNANSAVQSYLNPTDAPPTGITYTNGYDGNGNAIYSKDANNIGTEQLYDPLNRLVKTLQDHAGTGGTHDTTTQYGYDARDNLRSVVDPNNLTTSYTYDGLNNLTALSSPDTGGTGYTYDTAGNRSTQTDARGVVSTYSYDALNRLTGIAYPTSSLNITYAYDQAASGCYNTGRLTQITDSSGSTTYCYDLRGNVAGKTQVTNGTALTTAYGYSLADRLMSVTYPSGGAVTYTRDGAGRVGSVSWTPSGGAATTLISSASYLPFGPLNVLTFGNGRVLTKTYDKDYAIDKVVSSDPNGLIVDATVDLLGNVKNASSAVAASPPTQQYVYDPLYRLTTVQDGSGTALLSFAYNATGDRTSKTPQGQGAQSYTYTANTHHLASVAGASRSYDANGNTTSANATTFTYDDRNRLSAAAGVAYNYNGRGERVYKSSGTLFVYGENGQLLGEYNASGAVQKEYLWFDSTLVGTVAGSTLYYVETDQLGTPRVVVQPGATTASDTVVWRWDYFANNSAFGENAPSVQTVTLNLRFPGQYYDAETGLSYNYFRDYEAGTGRYVESDPIGLGDGSNTYAYVRSRPLKLRDPFGLTSITQCANPVNAPACAAAGAGTAGGTGTGAGSSIASAGAGVAIGTAIMASGDSASQTAPDPDEILVNAPVPPFSWNGSALNPCACQWGRQVVEPSRAPPGGISIEQEFICAIGTFTWHIIYVNGQIVHNHFRPGPPKGGGGD